MSRNKIRKIWPGRRPVSQLHPLLYTLIVGLRRLARKLYWRTGNVKYASSNTRDLLPYRIKKHQSVLLRKLGEADMRLQHNKVTNLRLAIPHLDMLLIRPGETFSFCKLVGLPTARKGYLEGMELSFGEARPGIGGGLCQLANLINWLVLHSPLTITERHHHSFDPFPDDGRVLPFGSGAAIFYNYIDYQFHNPTPYTFQLHFWISEKCLEGELRIDTELEHAWHVYERNHEFLKTDGVFYRSNEIWRKKIAKFRSGEVLEDTLILKNHARMAYIPPTWRDVAKTQSPEIY